MADIVVNASPQDRHITKACVDYLAAAGFDVWWVDAEGPNAEAAAENARGERDAARIVLTIWSPSSVLSDYIIAAAGEAAASGRILATRSADLAPRNIPAAFQTFSAIPVTDMPRVVEALLARGIAPRNGASADDSRTAVKPVDLRQLEQQAWTFVNRRGDPRLIQRFLESFPHTGLASRAQKRLAEVEGMESPDENERKPYMMFTVVGLLLTLGVLFGLSRLSERTPVRITIAAGGSDGLYQRLVSGYNDYLRQFGVELVVNPDARTAFGNVRALAEGKVNAALVKGGFAGAVRDPEYMNEARIKARGAEWGKDWSAEFKDFVSLGRVALEPLWVFTFGASERNQLSELDGEPVNLGSMEGGARTLSALLLEANHVRFRSGLWLDAELPPPKPGDRKPLGEARALFLQQPAESPRVRAYLANLAGEKHFDKAATIKTAVVSPRGDRIAVVLGEPMVRIIDARTGTLLMKLEGHTEEINDIAFSPDGARIATGADDNTIRLWDAATGKPVGEPWLGSGKDINSVAFSPDGNLIVSASDSDRATIRETATGKIVRYLEAKEDGEGHYDDVSSAVFSPDGKLVVTASRDGTARVWDVATGRSLAALVGHTEAVSHAVFNPDGSMIATASWDNTARLWDVTTGLQRLIMKSRDLDRSHDDIVRTVEFSPDGKHLLSASWDDSARLWDIGTGRELRRFNGLHSNVNGAGFTPDGKIVMTASQDSTIRLWNVETGAKVSDYKLVESNGTQQGHQRALHLMSFEADADAYLSRYPFLTKVLLPKGGVSFEPHVPAHPVTLLATTLGFAVDRQWARDNPSLVRVLADAIVHRPLPGVDDATKKPRMFYRSGQFPTLTDPEFEVSPLAVPIYRTGDLPFLLGRLARMKYIPFGTAAWIDEHFGTLVLLLIPLFGILVPLMRAIPALYNWTVRRRILYWYRRMQVLEQRLDREDRALNPNLSTPEIDKIDTAVSRIRVPLNYADQYYDLRSHIDLVRQRLASRKAAISSSIRTPT